MTETPVLLCPVCPLCGQVPAMILAGAVQAFCGNDECRAMSWNPSETAAENLHVAADALPTVSSRTRDSS
jgi:hypothetical protein